MKSIGIEQLRTHLSEYVRLAGSGELILVSDHDEVVAELGPTRHRRPASGSVEGVLDRLAQEGHLTRAQHSKRGWTWTPRALGLPRHTAERLLEALRSDR